MRASRIMITDDNELLRRGVSELLDAEPDLEVIYEASMGTEALAKAVELKPDVVVLDISLPDVDGFAVAQGIKKAVPSAEILVLSQHDVLPMAQEAIRRGVRGYLVKSQIAAELVLAVRAVGEKQQYLSSKLGTGA